MDITLTNHELKLHCRDWSGDHSYNVRT